MKSKVIAVLAAFIIGLGIIYANSYQPTVPPQSSKFDVIGYEKVRANLYDAALDLCIEAEGSYVWNEGLDDETKSIIIEYRVPSLEVLLRAIDTMDEFGGDLADSFDVDGVLGKFDKARRAYDEFLNR